MMRARRVMMAALLIGLPGCGVAWPDHSGSPLVLERKIALPDTKGRIDHLAIDLADRRLFVAEVANGTVDIVDLGASKVAGRITGLSEPQGMAWLPDRRELVVACGDGSVRFYAADRHELARIDLGDDADNIRIDRRNGHALGLDVSAERTAGNRRKWSNRQRPLAYRPGSALH
ncbi:hypothetical protein [uncultured Sphingomonas sp.]|uniref:YncE family protein n=1 Tax=uncultured Sphingomonas sp. TaxID=158754 RepID=UPI00262A8157|nr:hypothetical protein [uncultured Sphingomonas sp.]